MSVLALPAALVLARTSKRAPERDEPAEPAEPALEHA
jgi:hypothetical protein